MTEYAIVIYFDKNSEEKIFEIQRNVSDFSGNNYMIENNIPPHITISSFARDTHEDILDVISSFAAKLSKIEISLTSIGIFNSSPSVVNILPVVTKDLKQMNAYLHSMLAEKIDEFNKYYIEPNWVPHCAIAVKLSKNQLLNAVSKTCQMFSPLPAHLDRIALASCNPYKEIQVWNV